MKDKWGRNIHYLRVSVIDDCNLKCKYCMPKEGLFKKKANELLSLKEIYKIVRVSSCLGISKIRITGGEPLIRQGVVECIDKISKLKNIGDIGMTTNGILLRDYAKDLKRAGLKSVNISLDSLDEKKYAYITGGAKLSKALDGIKAAKDAGLIVKINTVYIGGFNENEIENFIKMSMEEDMPVRFIELMPIGEVSGWSKSRFISTDCIKKQIATWLPVYDGYKKGPAVYYKNPKGKGEIGLIQPISNSFCTHCNRIRLTADGTIKPCLHSDDEISLKPFLEGTDEDLKKIISRAIHSKPKRHFLKDHNTFIKRDMVRIGG